MLINAEQLSMNYGMKQLFHSVNIFLNTGDKIGIIGINGTGKSTLLRVLGKKAEADAGTVNWDPNVQVSFLEQNPIMDDRHTVLEAVFSSFPSDFRELKQYEAISMLSRLGIYDMEQKIDTLSGGQKKRVALATTLIHPADVLILDEPTNHLDADMVSWLEQWLKKFRGGMIMVTHDRYFLERVVTRIVELSNAQLYTYEANYSAYLALKAEREDMDIASQRKRMALLRREHEWIMRGCRARSTKSKDRIERYHALTAQTGEAEEEAVQMSALASRLGKEIISLNNISKAYDEKTVVSNVEYRITRGDRIGIVGHNGAGKSTLLNMAAGRLVPDSGTVEIGQTAKIGYFTQEGRELDSSMRVYDYITDIATEITTEDGTLTASQMLERFLFTADLQYTTIGRLSGGERRRLFLLSILMEAPNILLLDEPTNDLDIATLAILEQYLETFSGPVLSVSHDRYFLDKVVSQIFEVGHGGVLTRYMGNYTEYLEQRPVKESPPEKKTTQPKSAPPKQQKLKFSFGEQREYNVIDDEIAALEEKISHCDTQIQGASTDYVALQEWSEKKEILEEELSVKMDRWVYLSELAEKINEQ